MADYSDNDYEEKFLEFSEEQKSDESKVSPTPGPASVVTTRTLAGWA